MTRRRLSGLLVVVGLLLLALAGAGLVLREGDDPGSGSGPLSWAREPRVHTPDRLPGDRILSGRLRNDSLRRVRIPAGDVRLVDAEGETVEASVSFLRGYLHGLYPPTREPGDLAESELRRTGRLASIAPGGTVPVTVAWHASGAGRPVRLDYGRGSVPLPGG